MFDKVEYDKNYYLRNKDKKIKQSKEWAKNNPDKYKKNHKDYYGLNKKEHV